MPRRPGSTEGPFNDHGGTCTPRSRVRPASALKFFASSVILHASALAGGAALLAARNGTVVDFPSSMAGPVGRGWNCAPLLMVFIAATLCSFMVASGHASAGVTRGAAQRIIHLRSESLDTTHQKRRRSMRELRSRRRELQGAAGAQSHGMFLVHFKDAGHVDARRRFEEQVRPSHNRTASMPTAWHPSPSSQGCSCPRELQRAP